TQFNFDDAVKALQSGKKLNGKDGVLTDLIKITKLQSHYLTTHKMPRRLKFHEKYKIGVYMFIKVFKHFEHMLAWYFNVSLAIYLRLMSLPLHLALK
ncbi:hypothetical protein, partial [Pseudoalteromonas luteoviolacea]|uniref:hypothetical protein n=1 Tax=Pseudoalteromonas luteoviolacea TaxID=43657 RepID=UPI001E5C959F